MTPSRPATRNATAATARKAPPPATIRSRRTSRRSCSGGSVIADAAPRGCCSVALCGRRDVGPVLAEDVAVVLLAAVVERQAGDHTDGDARDRAVLLVPLRAVEVVPRPGQVDRHRAAVDDREHVRQNGPTTQLEQAVAGAGQLGRP